MLEYQGRPVAHRGRAGESCCIFFLALFRGDLEHLRMRAQLVRVACKALAGGKIEAYPYVQPVAYDPGAQMMGAYYAYPQYYQPGNPGFPQPLAPIDRADAEALAEAAAAAAAAKGADDDAAPGEPEEGTPKLKPRADTFDGPAL